MSSPRSDEEDEITGAGRYGASKSRIIQAMSKRPKFRTIQDISSSSSSAESDSDDGSDNDSRARRNRKADDDDDDDEDEDDGEKKQVLKPIRSVLRIPPPQVMVEAPNDLLAMRKKLALTLAAAEVNISDDEVVLVPSTTTKTTTTTTTTALTFETSSEEDGVSSEEDDQEEDDTDMTLKFQYEGKKFIIHCTSTATFGLAVEKFMVASSSSNQKFIYKGNGDKLSLDRTPLQLDLEDGDQIDVKLLK
ncbi:hypothetical protein BASA81_000692 [Batrachochytrium salamandrivorans]|nr:hypothetical protein BASA81_000692 [Batrachochytrium salamandrivorans]